VLDKVLHNHREIAPDVLRRADVRCLFLLRNAERDDREHPRHGAHDGTHRTVLRSTAVAAYYAERLARMEDYASQVVGRRAFVESEPMVDDTARRSMRLTQMARARRAVVGSIQDISRTPGSPATATRRRPSRRAE
jgi:hypothetical protein